MSTNLPAATPEAKPAQDPTPGTNSTKPASKPDPAARKPEADPKQETNKPDHKSSQK